MTRSTWAAVLILAAVAVVALGFFVTAVTADEPTKIFGPFCCPQGSQPNCRCWPHTAAPPGVTAIGADICCPQGSIPGCFCFPDAAVPLPCPDGYGHIPGTALCGVVAEYAP